MVKGSVFLIAFLWLVRGIFCGTAFGGVATEDSVAGAAKVYRYLNTDILKISGDIRNTHEKGIGDVFIRVDIQNGPKTITKQTSTDAAGHYEVEAVFPPGTLAKQDVVLALKKTSYAPIAPLTLDIVSAKLSETDSTLYLARADVVLRRVASPGMWISAAVLFMIYVLIGLELLHRTLAALLGAALLLAVTYIVGPLFPDFKIISFETAVQAVDMNVILLLFSMMVIVGISEKSGMFQWVAFICYRLAGGRMRLLLVALMAVTGILSAFLDNVTTMLLVIPVTLEIAKTLKMNPVSLILPEVFASNVGGAATLIGDPPNIMIGSYANLSFLDFVRNLSIPCVLALAAAVFYFMLFFRRDYSIATPSSQSCIANIPPIDVKLLIWSIVFLALTILLFFLHSLLEMPPSIAALIGAAGLLIMSGEDISDLLANKIEWSTLIFFAMLFVVVAAAVETGLIHFLADQVKELSKGSLVISILLVLWVSAIASAIIDNIPFVATMLPVVGYMTASVPGGQDGVLWWALALGACLGGNGTVIGASANVVTVGMVEKEGIHISFGDYFKVCFPAMILSVMICMIWLLLSR